MTAVPILLLLASMTTAVSQPSQEPQQAWALTLDDPGAIVLSAWSPTGTCVAVATDTTVHVIDRAGRQLWTWNFRQTNRLIRVTYTLTVSPACDAVAVGGSSAYKYIWTANRLGKHVFFKTTGTPSAVKFSLGGDVLAVSTGARVGYLLSPQLAIHWSGDIGDLPVKWPSQVLETTAASPAEFTREDIEQIFDVGGWGQGEGDSVSDDGQWRVFVTWPYRGYTGAGTVELWGPGAAGYRERYNNDRNRQPRWTKPIGCPEAMITFDGMFVVVTGDAEHPDHPDDPDCDRSDLPTQVFDREGNPVVIATTDLRLTFSIPLSWDAPLTPEERRMLPDTGRRNAYSPDGKMLLISRNRELRLYRAPE